MESKNIIGIILAVVVVFSAAILFFSPEMTGCTDENDTTDDHGGIDRVDGRDCLIKIMRNDSEVRDLIGETYLIPGGIFNQTGESIEYICVPPENCNISYDYTPVTDTDGNIVGQSGTANTTGLEIYRLIIDTPNETVQSVEKVDRLPDWIAQIKG